MPCSWRCEGPAALSAGTESEASRVWNRNHAIAKIHKPLPPQRCWTPSTVRGEPIVIFADASPPRLVKCGSMLSPFESSSNSIQAIEYSSDDIRSRHSAEAAHESLRMSKEFWGEYLSTSKDRLDLEFDWDADETPKEKLSSGSSLSSNSTTSSSQSRSIYRDFVSALQTVTKWTRAMRKSTIYPCYSSNLD